MITTDDVVDYLGTPPVGQTNTDHLQTCVNAANDFVSRVRPDVTEPWPDDFTMGVVMLASRWYKRRGGEEQAVYDGYGPLPVVDADLQVLLGLGRWHDPVVS